MLRSKSPNRTDEQRARHAAAQRKSYYKKKYGAESVQFKALQAQALSSSHESAWRATRSAKKSASKSTRTGAARIKKPRTQEQKQRHAYVQRKSVWRKAGLSNTKEFRELERKEREGKLTQKDIEEGLRISGRKKSSLQAESLQNELVEEYGTSGTRELYWDSEERRLTTDEIIQNLNDYKLQRQKEIESYDYYLSHGLSAFQEKKREGAWN